MLGEELKKLISFLEKESFDNVSVGDCADFAIPHLSSSIWNNFFNQIQNHCFELKERKLPEKNFHYEFDSVLQGMPRSYRYQLVDFSKHRDLQEMFISSGLENFFRSRELSGYLSKLFGQSVAPFDRGTWPCVMAYKAGDYVGLHADWTEKQFVEVQILFQDGDCSCEGMQYWSLKEQSWKYIASEAGISFQAYRLPQWHALLPCSENTSNGHSDSWVRWALIFPLKIVTDELSNCPV